MIKVIIMTDIWYYNNKKHTKMKLVLIDVITNNNKDNTVNIS